MSNVSFNGYRNYVNSAGMKETKFYVPFDTNKYDAYVRLYEAENDEGGNPVVKSDSIKEEYPLLKTDESPMPSTDGISTDGLFPKGMYAYKFVFIDRNDKTKPPVYVTDPGIATGLVKRNQNGNIEMKDWKAQPDITPDNKYNIVNNNGTIINRGGPMKLIMPDEYYPGIVREGEDLRVNEDKRKEALNTIRNHGNFLGGGFNGISMQIPELSQKGYARIVGTPFTKDEVSSHKYWTQNALRTSDSLGTFDDFKFMQRQLFRNGMSWVADAALVNEGLEGIHFSNVLRHGKNSPFINWFQMTGLDADAVSLDVIPSNAKNFRYKFENLPFEINDSFEKNSNYNPQKPSKLVLYGEKSEAKNSYDITNNEEAVKPYEFEIEPDVLKRNIKYFKSVTGRFPDFKSPSDLEQIAQFTNFKIASNSKGGFELWDGNKDIPKLNYVLNGSLKNKIETLPSHEREQALRELNEGMNMVWDYSLTYAHYWTTQNRDNLIAYVTDELKNTGNTEEAFEDKIREKINDKRLPALSEEVLTKDVLKNILRGRHRLRAIEGSLNTNDYLFERLSDLPFETLPVSIELAGVLGSPYISKKAGVKENLGISRFELYKKNYDGVNPKYLDTYKNVDNIYKNILVPFTKDVLALIEKKNGQKLFDGDRLTVLGRYVANEIAPEISEFFFVKAMSPNADIKYTPEGNINYTEVEKNAENINLQSTGILDTTPEKEAKNALKRMIEFSKIFESRYLASDFTDALINKVKGKTENAYKVADVLVTESGLGLGFRFDASKDIAAIDDVKAGLYPIDEAWETVTDFWKRFQKQVKSVNPHAWTTAEITDLGGLIEYVNGNGRYNDSVDAELKYLRESGVTCPANYSYFYMAPLEMYGRNPEEGYLSGDFGSKTVLQQKIDGIDSSWGKNPGFLYSGPLDAVIHSYTFNGNHDKPRILHILAQDMELFFDKMKTGGKGRKAAAFVLDKHEADIDFEKISAPSVATGLLMKQSMEAVCAQNPKFAQYRDMLKKAMQNIVSGTFKGEQIRNPEAFGVRPFDIVLKDIIAEAEFSYDLQMPEDDKKEFLAQVLKNVLDPALDKYLSIYKTMVALPGDVTDFAGDNLGLTGFETKSKNIHQQNRNVIPFERLDDPNYRWLKEFNDKLDEIRKIRSNEKLSALNDGIPVSLPRQGEEEQIYPLLRYNDKGSVTLSLFTADGLQKDNDLEYTDENRNNRKFAERKNISADKISLMPGKENDPRHGMRAGLTPGTIFKDFDDKEYVVAEDNGNYYLRPADGEKITVEAKDNNVKILFATGAVLTAVELAKMLKRAVTKH